MAGRSRRRRSAADGRLGIGRNPSPAAAARLPPFRVSPAGSRLTLQPLPCPAALGSTPEPGAKLEAAA